MSRAVPRPKPPAFAVTRRRRSFGLDAPRPPDIERTAAAILAWLSAAMPQVFWLRAAPAAAGVAVSRSATLVLLLPGGRIAVLRVEAGHGPADFEAGALAEQCRKRRIAFARVASVEECRAALRRLGVEPEEE